jgi:hypothetical protein
MKSLERIKGKGFEGRVSFEDKVKQCIETMPDAASSARRAIEVYRDFFGATLNVHLTRTNVNDKEYIVAFVEDEKKAPGVLEFAMIKEVSSPTMPYFTSLTDQSVYFSTALEDIVDMREAVYIAKPRSLLFLPKR